MHSRIVHFVLGLGVAISLHGLAWIFIQQLLQPPLTAGQIGNQVVSLYVGSRRAGPGPAENNATSADKQKKQKKENNPPPKKIARPAVKQQPIKLPSVVASATVKQKQPVKKIANKQEPTQSQITPPESPQPEPSPQASMTSLQPEPSSPEGSPVLTEKTQQSTELSANPSNAGQMTGLSSAASNSLAGGGDKAGDGNTRSLYISELANWLARHKRYPTRAQRRKQQGTVKLEFTVDRTGQVLDYKILVSSGYQLLDEEVRKMLNRASPLPLMPDDITEQTLTLTVPIAYRLH